MSELVHTSNEQAAATAFNRQAPLFDELYGTDLIIQYKRDRVRKHIMQFLSPKSRILELNAGTGEDALHFARGGHNVHATDISLVMQEMLKEKIRLHEQENNITQERLSFTDLSSLSDQGPYDLIFSNFAGLNCTSELDVVLRSFEPLVKPGGHVTLVILPKFCLWETLLLFKGKFKTAFRRFSGGNKGTTAHVEGQYFQCWYYSPGFVKKHCGDTFEPVGQEGLCTIVPPSYIARFGEKHPGAFRFLKNTEDSWKSKWPWKNIGDYYIITLRKKKD
ncbi:MAG: class I SAM-dependent methyltransferase [Chitinophagaceae bacterium]|nr:class I SAM-dependent methyltransferase [Chitinophagaceae bacterium]